MKKNTWLILIFIGINTYWKAGLKMDNTVNYWRKKLDGSDLDSFPVEFYNQHKSSLRKCEQVCIDQALAKRISIFCGDNPIALFTFWISILNLLLYKHTKRKSTVLLTPSVYNDLLEQFLAMRFENRDQNTVEDYINQCKQEVLESCRHTPFSITEEVPYQKCIMFIFNQVHHYSVESYLSLMSKNSIIFYIKMGKNITLEANYESTDYDQRTIVLDISASSVCDLVEETVAKTPNTNAVVSCVSIPQVKRLLKNGVEDIKEHTIWLSCRFRLSAELFIYDLEITQVLFKLSSAYSLYCVKIKNHAFLVSEAIYCLLQQMERGVPLLELYVQIKNSNTQVLFMKTGSMLFQQTISENLLKQHVMQLQSINDFFRLIQSLYAASIIEIDYNGFQYMHETRAVGFYDKENYDISEEKTVSIQNAKRILLLGDTTGTGTIGLLYLASYLYRNGHQAYCHLNNSFDTKELLSNGLQSLLEKIAPDFVGISLKWFPHISRVLAMCNIIKSLCPKVKIILGGNTSSHFYEELICHPDIDYVIRGDGEKPLLSILSGVESPENTVVYKEGKVYENPITYVETSKSTDIYLSDLDKIMIPKNNLYYNEALYIYCGKGCDENCIYCAGNQNTNIKDFGRHHAFFRPIDLVRRDIIQLSSYTSKFIFDFSIPSQQQKTYEFYKSVFENINLKSHLCCFYCWSMPHKGFLKLLSNTFRYVELHLDIPSLSEAYRFKSILNQNSKQYSNDEILETVICCNQYNNISIFIDTVAGLPGYTQEDYLQGEKLLVELKQAGIRFKEVMWERLHAQPGAVISEQSNCDDIYSEAVSYQDYLKFSNQNMSTEIYPRLENLHYPCVMPVKKYDQKAITEQFIRLNQRLHELEAQHEKNMYQQTVLTYEELNTKVNCVANYLLSQDIPKDKVIAVLLPKSIEFIVALLGILKSGHAFLPISVEYPPERIYKILFDSSAFVITNEVYKEVFNINSREALLLHDKNIWMQSNTYRLQDIQPQDLAYIIYTSGSTGEPKGTMIEHKGLINLKNVWKDVVGIDGLSRVLWFADPSFDASLWEIFMVLFTGSTLFIPIEEIKYDRQAFNLFLSIHQITTLTAPPSFIETMDPQHKYSIRCLISAGAAMTRSVIENWKDCVKLYNAYGPTEATICSTIELIKNEYRVNSIGYPLRNVKIYIMDSMFRKQPSMVKGMICISGVGITRGYLNDRSLTDKYIKNIVIDGVEERIYITGDIGMALPDHQIVYLGREDYRIKYRGYRIELNEIEQCVCMHSSIKNAVVRLEGNMLVCYYTSDSEIAPNCIVEFVSSYLPYYMIPGNFVRLDEFPVTINGKIDYEQIKKKYLLHKEKADRQYDCVVKDIIECWKTLFDRSDINENSNFFELGGNSLMIMQFIEELEKSYPNTLKVADIFKFPGVTQLACHIEKQISI